MSASQPALFNVQEFTDDGITLVGGRLYTYAFGTTAQKVAYTDPEGTVPQTYTADGLGGQYIALNARGELPTPLYLASTGAYDISLKRADGSTVWTRKASGTENFNFLLTSQDGSKQIGNGGESIWQSFEALQLADYTALRAYSGPRQSAYITGYLATASPSGISGLFAPAPGDTTSIDDGAMVIVAANGMRWKRQYDGEVSAWWFGADPTGAADSLLALTNFHKFCHNQTGFGKGRGGYIPGGTYTVSDTLTIYLSNGFVSADIRTAGADQTVIKGNLPNKPVITLRGGSGRFSKAVWGGIMVDNTTTETGREGIRIDGAGGVLMDRWSFANADMAIRPYNLSAGAFTEGIVFNQPYFASSVNTWWRFSKGAGTNSFRSTGMVGGSANNSTNIGKIIIDDGCYPYLCPMDFTFWSSGPVTIFANANVAALPVPTFIGDITCETNQFLLGTGNKMYLAGDILNNGRATAYDNAIQLGSMYLCESSCQAANGSFVVRRKPWRTTGAAIGGAGAPIQVNAVTAGIDDSSNQMMIAISVTSANYQYDVMLQVTKISGLATLTASKVNEAIFNQAGYGIPTLTAVYPNVILTNAAWPLSTAYGYTVNQQNAIFAQ